MVFTFIPRLLVLFLFTCVFGLKRRRNTATGYTYWYREPLPSSSSSISSSSSSSSCSSSASVTKKTKKPDGTDDDDGDEPLNLFHGLCGFSGYLGVLSLLLTKLSGSTQAATRGCVIPEIDDVSINLSFNNPLSRAKLVRTVRDAMDDHCGGRAGVVLGHSLGTCMATWLLLDAPQYVGRVLLIDPICILLELPDVAFNFLYRPPSVARSSVLEWLMYVFVSTEAGIARYFRRNFYWYNNILPAEALQRTVELKGADESSVGRESEHDDFFWVDPGAVDGEDGGEADAKSTSEPAAPGRTSEPRLVTTTIPTIIFLVSSADEWGAACTERHQLQDPR